MCYARMHLISSGIFEDQGHEVSLKGDKSCIRLEFKDKPSIRIPLRCEGRLRYLDYLVPDIPENHVSDHALSAHAYEAEIPDKTLMDAEEEAVTRIKATRVSGLMPNLPNVRDKSYLNHRRLAHVGQAMYDATVAAVDGCSNCAACRACAPPIAAVASVAAGRQGRPRLCQGKGAQGWPPERRVHSGVRTRPGPL